MPWATVRPCTPLPWSWHIPAGSEVLFRIRRPFYFISSTMYIEDGAGEKLGEVQQQWHLWRRNYALFVGKLWVLQIWSVHRAV